MAYVDYAYYTDSYGGTDLTEADFPTYEKRAEAVIDTVTRYYVRQSGVDTLPEIVQTMLKTAVCAQADYLLTVGLDAAASGVLGTDYTVGKVHVGAGALANAKSAAQTMLAAGAQAALEQSGLLRRHMGTAHEPFAPFPLGWR